MQGTDVCFAGKKTGMENVTNETGAPRYRRVLLKLSGEALATGAEKGSIVNDAFVREVAGVIRRCVSMGVEVGVIVGAGNIWRGRQGKNMDAARADYMGMLATSINALALQDAFMQEGLDARVMTAFEIKEVGEYYTRDKAISHLKKGRVVIFGCGLGTPFFSTDTAAAVRAAEIGADVILMAKNIDGIYNADPKLVPTAVRYDKISYRDILSGGLHAIDSTATAFCMDAKIPLFVFSLSDAGNIYEAVMGRALGTTVAD